MAIDFPNSPTLNQVYTAGERQWRWDGTAWTSVVQAPVPGPTGPTGPTGPAGDTASSILHPFALGN